MTKYKVTLVKFKNDFITGMRVPRYKVITVYADNEEDAKKFAVVEGKVPSEKYVQSVEEYKR